MVTRIQFPPNKLPEETVKLRLELRAFLMEERRSGALPPPDYVGMRVSHDFTRRLGERGFIGLTWPKEYGGGGRGNLDRYVVTEELLAAGAPVRLHWVTDRQTGPIIMRFGTEAQKKRYLPDIATGKCVFAIGLSEPDLGSDLASLRTRATKVDGGWRINGAKLWTSNIHHAQQVLTLARTTDSPENRHNGMSQFIVPVPSPGLTIRPIINIAHEHDFNEVLFDDVFVADDALLGVVDQGWQQVGTELAYERSGPERWLSAFRLLAQLTEELGGEIGDATAASMGRIYSHLLALRQMSLSVAGMLEIGKAPNLEAAVVKDLGTCFEQEMVRVARDVISSERLDRHRKDHLLGALLDHGQLWTTAFTIRGGAREVMRGIIARGLGLR
ncbi:acyl-CoA dehydrogenase family protein [Chelativorans sp. AA-79]|uniref:acyl-CoA dehydrogenase family protein n=1 Tax=Chelativorans sp. AA-79 TaxID=3028735 RepID=UPI0023F79F2C|nr:acyl-CoA dehydrogenase family protein [Chelativorans sp. AA-79]WEX12447.1 acyl-CoA dehydrogenase family protein [Chelativorans sp. AA-79]